MDIRATQKYQREHQLRGNVGGRRWGWFGRGPLVLAGLLFLASCKTDGADPCVLTVSVDPLIITVAVGLTQKLTAGGTRSGSCADVVRVWSSSSPSVAVVTSAGDVTGIANGSATITVKDVDSSGQQASASVTVTVISPIEVSVSTPSPVLAPGGTTQLTASVSGSSNGAVTWSSSAPNVLSVSGTGLATGLAVGVATVTATSVADASRNGTVSIRVDSPPSILAGSPAVDEVDVLIDVVVEIRFSEALNPSSVNESTIQLTGPAGSVPGTVSYADEGPDHIARFHPVIPLTESNTTYTVRVTSGITDLLGLPLVLEESWQFVTVIVDPNYYYWITNQWLGPDRALDTFSNTRTCFMGDNTGVAFTGQRWYFEQLDPSTFLMRSQFGGEGQLLEGGFGAPDPCHLMPPPDDGAPAFSGQAWHFVPFGGAGYYRMQTQFLGETMSLSPAGGPEIDLDGDGVPETFGVYMLPAEDLSGHAWKFARQGRREPPP